MKYLDFFMYYGIEEYIKFISLPRSLAKSARNIIDVGSNLRHLEAHDQVSGKICAPLGVVVDGGSSREGEDIRDGSTDELEGVVLISS